MNKRKKVARLKHRRRRLRYEVKRQELIAAGIMPAQAVLRRARPSMMAVSAAEVSESPAKASGKTQRTSAKAVEVSDGPAKARGKTQRDSKDSSRSKPGSPDS